MESSDSDPRLLLPRFGGLEDKLLALSEESGESATREQKLPRLLAGDHHGSSARERSAGSRKAVHYGASTKRRSAVGARHKQAQTGIVPGGVAGAGVVASATVAGYVGWRNASRTGQMNTITLPFSMVVFHSLMHIIL